MQAVILAAGKGSRLHPITLNRSKAMLPILGKPMVVRVMEDIISNGITDFILVTSPDDFQIKRYFEQESQLSVNIIFVTQPDRRGMADALRYAAPFITKDFILSACDNLISTEHIKKILYRWQAEPRPNGILTLMPVTQEVIQSVGVVELEGQWLKRIIEKPSPDHAPSNIASLPLYCFSTRILNYLAEVKLSSRGEYELQDAIQMLIERDGAVCGVETTWRQTVTNAADLLAINKHYLIMGNQKPQLAPYNVGIGTHLITPLHIEEGTIIGKRCLIGPNVYIERDCRIGNNVCIKNAVILRDTRIENKTKIENQVYS